MPTTAATAEPVREAPAQLRSDPAPLGPATSTSGHPVRRHLVLGPLPSSATPVPLRRLPLPVLEPLPAQRDGGREPAVGADQGMLDLGLRISPPGWSRRTFRTSQDGTADDDLPIVQQWAARFVQAAVEAAAGIRPTAQLVRWTTPDVQTLLERRAGLSTRLARRALPTPGHPGRGRVLVRRVLCSQVTEGVYESSAVVQDHGRTRAVALRVERFENRWHATALELG